jgi:hypothetical protein
MVLVQPENLSSQCKVQGDCQWGTDGRREEGGSLKAAAIQNISCTTVEKYL